jgi:hypothetical protein
MNREGGTNSGGNKLIINEQLKIFFFNKFIEKALLKQLNK